MLFATTSFGVVSANVEAFQTIKTCHTDTGKIFFSCLRDKKTGMRQIYRPAVQPCYNAAL